MFLPVVSVNGKWLKREKIFFWLRLGSKNEAKKRQSNNLNRE